MKKEEYDKKKQEIYAGLQSGKLSQDEAAKQMTALIGQHPEGKGLNDFTEFIQKFPATAQSMVKLQSSSDANAKSGKVAAGLRVLSDLGMTSAAIGQIATGNKAAAGLVKPELAAVPGYNPQLTQALYEAQRGVVNPNAVLDPAKQQIQQGYQNALMQNQIASGGQAGSLQALNQVANLQRMQSAVGLAPLAQDVKMQNAGNYNQLLGMRQNETQNMFQNQASNADSAYDRYRFAAQAAGAAGASGRQNLQDASQRLAEHLGEYQMNNPNPSVYNPAVANAPEWARNPGFDPTHNDFMRKAFAERSLRNTPSYSSYSPSFMDKNMYYSGYNPRVNQKFNP